MKKLVVRIVLAVACMGLGVAFAEDKGMTKVERDECLLMSKNCKNTALSIQEKIKKLQGEIKKGKKTYSAEEIKKLEDKLKDAENTLDVLLKN